MSYVKDMIELIPRLESRISALESSVLGSHERVVRLERMLEAFLDGVNKEILTRDTATGCACDPFYKSYHLIDLKEKK